MRWALLPILLALAVLVDGCGGRLPIDINVAGGSQSRPRPASPSPDPDVQAPPREAPPADPSPESFPLPLPLVRGRWTAQLSLQACVTTVSDPDVRADCAASVARLEPFELTLRQERESVTGVSMFESRSDDLHGSVDRDGLFRFVTERIIDLRSRDGGLLAIAGAGTFKVSGSFVTGHYVVTTTRSESTAPALDGQTTLTWRIVSMDRL